MTRTLKPLAPKVHTYVDGSEAEERFAVLENGKRIGMVAVVTYLPREAIRITAYRGVHGFRGYADVINVEGSNHIMKTFASIEEATEAI